MEGARLSMEGAMSSTEGARLSVCSELSRSSSVTSYDSRASASTASPPSLRRQVSTAPPPAPVYINNLTVQDGGTGVHNGNLMNFTVNQFIGVVPGEDGKVSTLDPALIEDLVTDAVKINTHNKQFFDDELCNHKGLYGTKEDMAKAQKKWCFWLLGLVVLFSIIPLATSALYSVLSAPHPPHTPPAATRGHLDNSLLPELLDDPNADILNMKDGPRIFPRAFWVAQPPTGELDNNNLPVRQVVVCYTATDDCDTPSECALRVRYIQEFHIYSRKWFDIGYNFLIGSDGNVYEGRGWDLMGAHTKGHNNGTLGVAFIGTFADKLPNPDMVDAFNKLVIVGIKAGKIAEDYNLVAQCQLTITGAPGMALARNMSSWPHYDHSLPLRCV